MATLLAIFTTLASAQRPDPATPTAASGEPASAPVAAGKVDLIDGDVRFFDKDNRMRRPKPGEAIHQGESIFTGADGEVHFNMEDGGYIGVRPNTSMRINEFKAEGGAEDRSVIGLLEGSFRSVTGWIGRLGSRNYKVVTPTATIGVRGTEHEPLVIPEGSALGEPGTYDRVHIGETVIETPQGAATVRPNQAGFVPHRGVARPSVLSRVPDFFRPTRNEGRFKGLHGRVGQQLEMRREERSRSIEQRRKQQLERRDQRKPALEHRQEERKQLQEERNQLQDQRRAEDRKQMEEQRRQAQERKQFQKQREESGEKAGKAKPDREQKRRERKQDAAEHEPRKRGKKSD